ncbi:MAG TPA: hypothetical protein VMW41_06095 [Candidatus Bathyarchaeia archaeon]|nr:hypothetical protein [Candidatus Bathyarchaeia archaeon]
MLQTQPHKDIDPVDHTLYALNELDTEALSREDRLIARTVLIFHDIGKVHDAFSREHPRRSVDISRDYLVKTGYSANQVKRVIHHICWHDALGDVARIDGRNIFDERDVLTFFPDETELRLHREIVIADVASIPDLARYVSNIQITYQRLLEKLADHRGKKAIEPEKELPFETIGVYQYHQIYKSLDRTTEFDDVDIVTEMASRRADFEALSAKDQEIVEKTIIQGITSGSPRALNALKLTGRETDTTFIDQLEEKYDLDLEPLRALTYLFGFTYLLWELNWNVQDRYLPNTPGLMTQIRGKLIRVRTLAQKLGQYELVATHATTEEGKVMIDQSMALLKSTDFSSHYEGEGVYTGIFGCFRTWATGGCYEMVIALADTLPIISNYRNPGAMTNNLCEMLDIEYDGRAIAHGLVQWYKMDSDYDEIPEWKVALLENLLGSPAEIITDEYDRPCITMDTQENPIIWASLCRGLRIRRFIPKKFLHLAEFATRQKRDKLPQPERPATERLAIKYPYEEKPIPILRIHGLSPMELERMMAEA